MKRLLSTLGLSLVTLVPSLALAAPAVADKADNAFMMICTALVLFMTLPGVALFYGGLLRSKNVLSMLTQVTVTFALVCVLWVIYGYSLAFSEGNAFFGGFQTVMLKGIGIDSLTGTFSQMIHVAFQCSFACITVALVVAALPNASASLRWLFLPPSGSRFPTCRLRIWFGVGASWQPTARWTLRAVLWCISTPPVLVW